MKAHVIENGVVVNTIIVDKLTLLGFELVDASKGGTIGDTWDGKLFTTPIKPRDVAAEISALEATITPTLLRQAVLAKTKLDPDTGLTAKQQLKAIDDAIDALNAQL